LADAIVSHGLRKEVKVIGNVIPGIERPLPGRGQAYRFMMVADLVDKTKNVSGVLRAIRQCKDEGLPVELDVIGGGEDMDMLKQQASNLGLNGSVRWHGRVSQPEVLDRMAHTGTVIINSNVETFSVVTGEALAMGKPVIATRCGGPQAFIQESNGVLIEPKNDTQLAEAMRTMVRDHHRYDPATIRRTIAERFSPRSVGEQFRSLYQQVLNGK
jgi:glycosyltransferase involved in cell wall biosynthesis